MSNVVEFKRPPKKEDPKPPNPNRQKLLFAAGAITALIAAWAYFQYIGG